MLIPSTSQRLKSKELAKPKTSGSPVSWAELKNVDAVYDNAVNIYGDIGQDKNEFRTKMLDAKSRKLFHINMSKDHKIGSFEQFEKTLANDLEVRGREDLDVIPSTGKIAAIKSGAQQSVAGLAVGGLPDVFQPTSFVEDVFQAGSTFTLDMIPMVLGSLFFKAAEGGIALTEGLRAGLMTFYEEGLDDDRTFKDYMKTLASTVEGAVKGAIIGKSAGLGGKLVKNPLAKVPLMVGTMTAAGGALEGEMPKAKDFAINGMLLGGMHLGTFTANRLRTFYKTKGVKPNDLNLKQEGEALREILTDKTITDEVAFEKIRAMGDETILKDMLFPGEWEKVKTKPLKTIGELQKQDAVKYEAQRLIDEGHTTRIAVRERAKERSDVSKGKTTLTALENLTREAVAGLKETAKAVGELLKPDPNALGFAASFSEDAFKKAKVHFDKGWIKYKAAGKELPDFMLAMEIEMGDRGVKYLEHWRKGLALSSLGDPNQAGHEDVAERTGVKSELNEMIKVAERWKNKLIDAGSVENKFQREGMREVGHAIKVAPSRTELIVENGYRLATKMLYGGNFKFFGMKEKILTKKDMSAIPLLQEGTKSFSSLSPDQAVRLREPVKMYQKFFDDAKAEYKKYGVDVDFMKHAINEMSEKLLNTPKLSPADRATLEGGIKFLETKNFSHIPIYLWFANKMTGKSPGDFKKTLNLLNTKKRKTWTISDLVKDGKIKESDINFVDIMMSYSRRMGKDFAMLEILDAAKKDRTAFTTGDFYKGVKEGTINPELFVDPPGNSGIFKGHKVHALISDWSGDMSRAYSNWGFFNKILSTVKMAKFIQPFFLPSYDMFQTSSATIFRSLRPSIIKKSVNDVLKRTEDYQRAMWEGLASKPEVELGWKVFQKSIEDLKKSPIEKALYTLNLFKEGSVLEGSKRVLSNPILIQSAYNTAFKMAWNMDQMVRMMTYNYGVKNQKMGVHDAAQWGATVHSDYASIPMKTRRALNVPFFTPTFKLTMGKYFFKMMRAATDVAKHPVDTFKNPDKVVSKNLATGIVGGAVVLMATDLLMTKLGFDIDEMGRKYCMKLKDGREMSINIADTVNMYQKFVIKTLAALNDPGVDNKMARVVAAHKWEIQPFWKVSYECITNKDAFGDQIYSEGDDWEIQAGKTIKYAVTNTFEIFNLFHKTKHEKKALEAFKKEFGNDTGALFNAIVSSVPFANAYVREGEMVRKRGKLKAKINRLKKELFNGTLTNEKQLEKFLDDIDRIIIE